MPSGLWDARYFFAFWPLAGALVTANACTKNASPSKADASGGSDVAGTGGAGGAAGSGAAAGTTSSGGQGGSSATGGSSGTGGEAGQGAGDAGASGSSTDSAGAGSYGGGCPPSAPASGACSPVGRVCSYGEAPRIQCRDRLTCTDGTWAFEPGECEPPYPTRSCPNAARSGGDCDAPEQRCGYADGSECRCSTAATPRWECDLTMDTGRDECPLLPPNAGTLCDPGAGTRIQPCTYRRCTVEGRIIGAVCLAEGVWQVGDQSCVNPNR